MPELIRTIMDWTLDFLRERLLVWIQDQGGWVRPLTPNLDTPGHALSIPSSQSPPSHLLPSDPSLTTLPLGDL